MFELSSDSIEHYREKKYHTPQSGAVATFEGRVRNNNEGNAVESLDYEVYAELALKEGKKIISEARERFDILTAFCVHRVGHLQVGDLAVFIAVTSGHRDEAFKACRFIIDEIKARLPVWKKEHYSDRSIESQWVYCAEEHHHN